MNYLLESYFANKDDIKDVLSFLYHMNNIDCEGMAAADEKMFELFETELFVLSHLEDKNLSETDLDILLAFVESPGLLKDFQAAYDQSKNQLHKFHKKMGHVFDFELRLSEQKLNEIAELFSELDKLVHLGIAARKHALH